jgi:hypothetical protein
MVWTVATLGIFSSLEGVEEKLADFHYSREEEGFKLRSIVQLSPIKKKFSEKIEILSGIVADEYIKKTRRIIEDEKGKWKVIETDPFVDTMWTEFWLTTESMIFVERMGARSFAFRVVSQALTSRDDYIRPVQMDIYKIAADHPGHWLGSITERDGHMQNATLFGDNLEADDVIGSEYQKSKKKQVGFITEYFGAPVKIRVTESGTIMVLTNLHDQIERYIQYVSQDLLSYAAVI